MDALPARRKFSQLWNHFSLVDEKRAMCRYCSKQLSLSGSSIGTLRRHLKAWHDEVFVTMTPRKELRKFFEKEKSPQRIEPPSSTSSREANTEPDTVKSLTNSTALPEMIPSREVVQHLMDPNVSMSSNMALSMQEPPQKVNLKPAMKTTTFSWQPVLCTGATHSSATAKGCDTPSTPAGIATTTTTAENPHLEHIDTLDEQLVRMIASGYHPLGIVQDPEFVKLISMLNPGYRLPSRKNLAREVIPSLYSKVFEKVKNEISQAAGICVTIDKWTSQSNAGYAGLTGHYINKETKFYSVMLGYIKLSENDSHEIYKRLKETFQKWNLENLVDLIVADNGKQLAEANHLGNWRLANCFAQTMSSIVEMSISNIAPLSDKIRKIVNYFQNNNETSNKLMEIQKQMYLKYVKLTLDDQTHWPSTVEMLQNVLATKDAIIATIAFTQSHLRLESLDWVILEQAVSILALFLELHAELRDDSCVLASKVIVYCTMLPKQILKWTENTSFVVEARELVASLNESFNRYFHDIENDTLLVEATVLDPRFKNRGFSNPANFDKAILTLRQEAARFNSNELTEIDLNPTKPFEYSIWSEFDDKAAKLRRKTTGAAEVDIYLAEPFLSRHEDPLKWWHNRKAKYPCLYNLMCRHLNLVAVAMPFERTFPMKRKLLARRRTRMKAKALLQLGFIHCNI